VTPEDKRTRDMRTIFRYGEEEAPDVFAGAERSLDDESILVAFTADREEHLARLRERVDHQLRLIPARYTLTELQQADTRLLDEAERFDFDRDGLVVDATGLDIESNAVVWELFARDRTAARALLQERYGDILQPEFIEGGPFEQHRVMCTAFDTAKQGMLLRVAYSRNASFREVELSARETQREVTVEILVQEYQGTAILKTRPAWAEATLTEPLGDRGVIDAATGLPVERRSMTN
jgi:hypothetical protein